MARTVITFGTYDLFHYGHLRIIQRAKALGDRLVVGVSSDQFNYEKKGERPAVNEDQRMALVGAIAFLIAATLGSGWYSNRKDLARAWK